MRNQSGVEVEHGCVYLMRWCGELVLVVVDSVGPGYNAYVTLPDRSQAFVALARIVKKV